MKRRLSLLALIVTVLALVLVVAGPALAQSAGSMFDYIITRKLLVRGTTTMVGAVTATGGVTGNLTGNVTGDLTGDVTAADVTATDDVVVGDDVRVTDDLIADTGTFTTTMTTANAVLTGNLTDSNSAVTIADNAIVDGAADAVQLTVQGYTTQTNALFVAETSTGTDMATISNAGLMTLAGGLVISDGDATIADDLKITKQTAITVTNGAAFTVTGTYQPIAAAGAVTPTITMGAAGDVVMIVNTSAQTITIADTSTTMLSAAWAGTQYDTLTLLCDGTNWLEISRSAN